MEKTGIVKVLVRSVGSTLQRSWCWWLPSSVAGACGRIAMLFRSMIGPLSLTRAAFKTYKVQESEYRKYLASDEVKSASAISDDLVSDAKTVRAMAKSVQTVKLVSSRSTGVKPGLTGDASTCELKKATETLNAQTLDLKSKLKALKADVFAVTTSQAHKQLLDPLGNRDKVLTESEGKVLDGD